MHNIFLKIFEKIHIQEEKPQRKLDNFDSFVKPLTLKEVRAKRAELEQNFSSLRKTDPKSEPIPDLELRIGVLNCLEAKLKELKKNKGIDKNAK